ncbi:MAG: GNAT family N-acetyltransferase [Caulobacteraceae bacterium]
MQERSDVRPAISLRLARRADTATIAGLIERSVRALQAEDYSPAQIEGALGTVFGVDTRLIDDGAYFIAECGGEIVGCGGWSWRRTLFGGDAVAGKDDSLLTPGLDPARIRAFFVAPEFARRGVGSLILNACEAAARARGFRELELGATLTGERLYQRRGFSSAERISVELANGCSLPIVRMRKLIDQPSR